MRNERTYEGSNVGSKCSNNTKKGIEGKKSRGTPHIGETTVVPIINAKYTQQRSKTTILGGARREPRRHSEEIPVHPGATGEAPETLSDS